MMASLLSLLLSLALLLRVQCEQPTSIQDYKRSLKRAQQAGACFKILTRDREYGCELKEGRSRRAPMQQLQNHKDPFNGERVIAVPLDELTPFLNRVEHNPALEKRVVAVLALPREGSGGFSSGAAFPNGHFPNHSFPYGHRDYAWNPSGTGLRYKRYPFPIFLADDSMVTEIEAASTENHKQGYSGALFRGEASVTMLAKNNSIDCINNQACLPIGGHSVLGLYPPHEADFKSTIVVLTTMDTAGFFLDRVKGADSSLSGLIAMLTAIEILAVHANTRQYRHRLAFVALSGEPWDYMGSRRLIVEMLAEEDSIFGNTPPLDLSTVSKIVEIGQVGKPKKKNGKQQFYLHKQPGTHSRALLDSFLEAATGQDLDVDVSAASQLNPGLPPSSLMTWLSINASYEGIVLEEFNQHFINQYYESVLDDASNFDPEAVGKAAILVAQTLHNLATESDRPLQVEAEAVAATVKTLMECLVQEEPNLDCPLAQELMSVTEGSSLGRSGVEYYSSVIRSVDSRLQDSLYGLRNNLPRFIFNYMGQKLASEELSATVSCDLDRHPCSGESEVCVGHKALLSGEASFGHCVRTAVYFIPSYSLSVEYTPCLKKHISCGSSTQALISLWTESWPLGGQLMRHPGSNPVSLLRGLGGVQIKSGLNLTGALL